MAQRPTLFLVDGSNNLYRSYYAIRGLTTSSGLATNAVYGFTQMLRKLLKDHQPDAIGVAFDVGAPTFRSQQFVDYKKDRKPMPDDLSVQIPFIHEICAGLGIPVIGLPEYEADDLIGSLACIARDAGYRVVIATSDKDFFQLVGGDILLFHTTREILYDEKGVKEIFGLPPEQVVDVMAIWGDAIDNIPGVPGIGEKGAKSLIEQFGSLDAIYANLDQVKKPAHRKALEANRDQALMSRELARIKCDLVVDLDLEKLKLGEPDRAKLHEIFSRLEFTTLMQEYMPRPERVASSYRLVTSAPELRQYLAECGGRVGVHVEPEEAGLHRRPIAVALAGRCNEAVVVPVAEGLGGSAELLEVLSATLPSMTVVAHDVKAQLRRMSELGIEAPEKYDDTMLMSYVINPGLPSHDFEVVVRDRLTLDVSTRKELAKGSPLFGLDENALKYMGERADSALALFDLLDAEMKDEDLRRIYSTIELPLVPVLARMEERGIRVDVDLLAGMSRAMGDQIATLEKKIYTAAGEEFNINSPSQLGTILFEKLQYPVVKKTQKTKSFSTSVEVLNELASYGHEVPKLILEHRELHKLKSTYVDALPQLVGADGRVHTSFNQAVAATGRLSSSDPNLQNIPIRTAQGREIRRAFVADQGNVLLAADYSQIELRVLAHMTGDEELIDTFRRGADIHRATAAKIFNVHEQLVTPDQRRAMKTINFGVLYGMSAFRLSNELGISTGEAKEFIDAYFARYPKIQDYLARTLDEVRATGKVHTLFGRVRYITEIHNRSFAVRGNAERMAINAPIQGTAADLLKLAMIALDRRLPREAPMLLTVHDEIVIEVPEPRAEAITSLVRETMENIHPLAVPLAVETHWGRSWYEAKE
jgi:DNA polymerase-1